MAENSNNEQSVLSVAQPSGWVMAQEEEEEEEDKRPQWVIALVSKWESVKNKVTRNVKRRFLVADFLKAVKEVRSTSLHAKHLLHTLSSPQGDTTEALW